KIFEPFFSTKTGTERSGLGLTMVQGFVTASHGTVALDTAPGEGTTFTLRLPAAEVPAEDGTAVGNDAGLDCTDGLKDRFVLLVDDDEEVRTVLRRDLLGCGARLIEASGGAEALQLLEAVDGIDFVLSDITMPGGMSGVDLAAEIERRHPGKRIVLMTGFGQDGVRADLSPRVRVLQKPFERRAIVSAFTAGA
ncbi:MAG: response regulator, partial [Aurantimonas coralicida]